MRRPTFFISSRSHSADLLASELVLALCDQFPKTEGIGIVGKWMARTRVSSLGTLDEIQAACLSLGIEEGIKSLKETLAANLPQIAILVGYSTLHHELAGFFQQHETPVVLYEVTPQEALQGVNLSDAAARIKVALSIHKTGSAFIRAAQIPFHYIGMPYRDRVAKVAVKSSAFAFLSDKPLVTLFPGGYGDTLSKMIPLFGQFAAGILASNDCQIVVSLREEQDFDAIVAKMKQSLPKNASVHFVLGMHLELLSLSRLAITGAGAITIEAAIFKKPFLPVYDQASRADADGFYCLVNQSLGRKLVDEYSDQTPQVDLQKTISKLLKDSPERQEFIEKLNAAESEFLGSAAENSADYIANEVGIGRKKPERPVTPT